MAKVKVRMYAGSNRPEFSENRLSERDWVVQVLAERPWPKHERSGMIHRCEFVKETAVEVARMNRELVTFSLMNRKEEDLVMEINCVLADYQQALALGEKEVAKGLAVELRKWSVWAGKQV